MQFATYSVELDNRLLSGLKVAHDTKEVLIKMKQYRIIIDVNKVDPHKLQEMLNELATIDGVKTDKGMIEYDETLANTTQIREVVDKYLLGS